LLKSPSETVSAVGLPLRLASPPCPTPVIRARWPGVVPWRPGHCPGNDVGPVLLPARVHTTIPALTCSVRGSWWERGAVRAAGRWLRVGRPLPLASGAGQGSGGMLTPCPTALRDGPGRQRQSGPAWRCRKQSGKYG